MASLFKTQILFDIQLKWIADRRAVLSALDVEETIEVGAPFEFGERTKHWTPEQLFLSSISSSFMTTFMTNAKKLDCAITHYYCETIGQIETAGEEKYQFTHINLYPKIYIANEALKDKANLALKKTHEYCLITNSIQSIVIYHSEVLLDTAPQLAEKQHQ